ncbi:16S rRNA (guanine(527)-N(7))-methyltransferase RsmG [Bifidobacterium moukalabense]|uniref:16S rRNA (guanine(527)-N(7))-methyltransferase RsmG n=1 Tax=Bifidobacterium moukalabense TaxID=1333651 RepID=UPI0010F65619|nr:16S rRNA (guanine(527)-N(7))-methyltransferase RsmG [Bifidobacterium moukalabense]
MTEVTDELDDSPILEEVLGDALVKLRIFHTKLAREGEPRGLIGPRDIGIIWERHILNSASIVPFVRKSTAKRQFKTVADIGSGGGFPGIVAAACLPDHRFTLVEPMERRIEWLNECVSDMGLDNVTVVRARANEMIEAIRGPKANRRGRGGTPRTTPVLDLDGNPITIRHPFAVVTCRAVAPMTKLSGWTLPLLETGGRLIALKGRSAQDEIDKATREIIRNGGIHPRVVEAEVGPGLEATHILMVDKR